MANAGTELEQGRLMYLGKTRSEDWKLAVCDHCLFDKFIGGAVQRLGVGHFDTECRNDERCGTRNMWVCGGGKE